MRIGFTSDFHIGFAKGRREGEDYRQAREALKTLVDAGVDVIIHAGDVFDTPVPSPKDISRAFKLFSFASKALGSIEAETKKGKEEIPPIVAIHGTHERRARGEMNPVELLHHLGALYYLQNSHVVVNGHDFYGLGGVPESLAADIIKSLNPKPIAKPSFFIFHQNLRPFVPAKHALNLSDLPPAFDYYVDGHIHVPWHKDNLLIVGSTIVTQMKENEDKKGVWIFEDGNFEFISIKTRPFFVIKVDAASRKPEEIRAEIERKIEAILQKPLEEEPMIKIKVTGKLAPGFKPSDLDLRFDYDAIISVDRALSYEGLEINTVDKINLDALIMEAFKKVFAGKIDVDIEALYRYIMKGDAEALWQLLAGDENAP